MKTIAFASQKGGSGKTTLAAHVGVMLEAAGRGPAALLDVDPQGSLSIWWNKREADAPAFADPGDLANLPAKLDELRQAGFRWALIDTPPATGATSELAIRCADLVIIPTRASPHDLGALGSTIEICQSAQKPFVFALNAAKTGASITTQAVALLSEHGPVSPALIGDRVGYASSMVDGRTLQELEPAGRGAVEIRALVDFMISRFPELSMKKKEKARV
jgi:chromosome partitioning protein